jgi:hypothetical protein
MPGSRYRKSHVDLSKLDPNSQQYWEEILKREGLSMNRGLYPQRLSHGWEYFDTDSRNADCSNRGLPASPENDPDATASPVDSNQEATVEDNYAEDSMP